MYCIYTWHFLCSCISFRFENRLMYQRIEIDNNKHVHRQRQVRKSIGSGVEWAECSLIIGTGYWVQVLSLILDSSVGLWVGIQSAGDSVPETLVRILHSAEGDNFSLFDSKIACLCQSIEINNKHVCMYVYIYIVASYPQSVWSFILLWKLPPNMRLTQNH